MAKLDADVRSLINHLYFSVSDSWDDMMGFLWSPDTRPDAGLWLEPKPGTNAVQLKDEIREFVIQADAQMNGLPTADFVFGYPVTERRRGAGEPRPCFLAMPTRAWLPDVQRAIESAATMFRCEQKDTPRVPFDVSNYRYYEYDMAALGDLVAWLRGAFASVPARYRFDR